MSEHLVGRIFNPDAAMATGKPLIVATKELLRGCLHDASSCACPALYDRKVAERLAAVLAEMRADGQGLSHDQELTVRRGLGLP